MTFFFDNTFPPQLVTILKALKVDARHLQEDFAADTPDVDWLPEVGALGQLGEGARIMKRLVAALAVLVLLAFGRQPLPSSSRVLCDQGALQRALHDGQRRYDTVGTPGSTTSIEMPSKQDYGAMTRGAIRAGDLYMACGRPIEALQKYSYASQHTERYDPAGRTSLGAKINRAARLVLRDPRASDLDKRAARVHLCLHHALTSEAVYRCTRLN